jgi:uncharacterized HAD superfamily protein
MGAKPVKGAQKAIESLSKGNEIILVTDRPQRFMDVTKKWLAKWRIPYKEIRHMVGGMEDKHTYAEFQKINGMGFDAFIEDKLEDVILLARYCKKGKVLLFKRPWNRTKNVKRIFECVGGWKEIINRLTG